jgi:hypothetical protein
MLLLFAGTLFLSASLLFCVEPMVAKMLMPMLGGAPAVWITCMLFFQAALLAGYAYAHATTAWLGVRRQAMVHGLLLGTPLLVLPIHFAAARTHGLAESSSPVVRLLDLLFVGVGLPFFVVSTTGPLLQKWFSHAGHPHGRDPYFLYGSSNLGSMLALAAYPAVLEPALGLVDQSRLWRWGYVVFVVLVGVCAVAVLRSKGDAPVSATPDVMDEAGREAPVTNSRRLEWVFLAFVPSSLLLGVTTYVTTDIAAIPLFWVLPLALYLSTFIFVFARKEIVPHALMVRLLPLAVTTAVITILMEAQKPGWLLIPAHLLTLFLAAMVCHGELARDRPHTKDLTEFYLWVSVGGVLGGIFNALIAPALFNRIVEYPLAMVLACLCRRVPRENPSKRERVLDLAIPAGIGALMAVLVTVGQSMKLEPGGRTFVIFLGLPLIANYGFLTRPIRFALGIGAAMLAGTLYGGVVGRTIHAERNFFGVVRVTRDASGKFVQIANGNAVHGRQSLDPAERGVPLAYYHPTGPVGQVFEAFNAFPGASDRRVGVIGLGAGAMAGYAKPGQGWTFYEINPAVVRIATNPAYFTYLTDRFPGGEALTIALGDARLCLHDAPDHFYGLFVIDAFSSDAIPVHLLTREAIALYLAKLEARGILAAHVSNLYLDLKPVFVTLARDAGLVVYSRDDLDVSPETIERTGKTPSQWLALARRDEDLGSLASDARWKKLDIPGTRLWTDEFSNLLSVYRW